MRSWKFIGSLVTLIILTMLGWAVNRYVWFGPDLAPKDYSLELRKLQAAPGGASVDDFRAYELAVLMSEKFESLDKQGLSEPVFDSYSTLTEEERATLVEWIDAIEREGLYDDFRQLGEFSAYISPWDGSGFLGMDYSADFSTIRTMVRAGNIRAELAMDSGDAEPSMLAIRDQLAVSGLLLSQPIALMRLTGMGILSHSFSLARSAVRQGLSVEKLDELTGAYDDVKLYPLESLFRGEQLIAEETLATSFPNNRTLRVISRGAQSARLDEEMTRLIPWAKLTIAERRAKPYPKAHLRWDDAPVEMLLAAFDKIASANDQMVCQLAGMRVIIAIERYRSATGALPESIENLKPDYLAELPGDPYSDSASQFGYRIAEVSEDNLDGYVLYSVGYDGVDNSGTPVSKHPHKAFHPDSPGTDFVLNQQDWE